MDIYRAFKSIGRYAPFARLNYGVDDIRRRSLLKLMHKNEAKQTEKQREKERKAKALRDNLRRRKQAGRKTD